MKPQAIQTRYTGYHFRSRLEARYAVFFDALGIQWRYEPEGFELKSGYYLPDFYLPDHGIYCEVKPTPPDFTYKDKYMDLVADGGEPLIILAASEVRPDGHTYLDIVDESFRVEEFHGAEFAGCYRCDKILVQHESLWGGCNCKPCADHNHPLIQEAISAAKSARFEFGHKGAS